jgi:thiol-disulfide isomerase/thioredoxin
MVRGRAALVLVLAVVRAAHADPAPPAIDNAIKSAAAAKKALVVEFGASWCGPCKEFEKTVLPDPEVKKALGEVVFVHYDAEVTPGLEAAMRFRIDAFPSFLVIDRLGVERTRRRGGLGRDEFLDLVHDAKNHVQDEADIRAELKAHPKDADVQLRAARWFQEHHMNLEAIAHYKIVAADSKAPEVDRDGAAIAAEHLHRVDVWRHDLVADKVARIRAAPATATADDLAIATVDADLAPKDARALVASVLAATTDASTLNGFVYVALAAGAKDEALAAGKRLVAQRRDAQFLDTFAECLHVTGDRVQALQIEDEALALARGSQLQPVIERNRARFDSGTGESDEVEQLHARVADLWKRLEAADQLAAQVRTTAPSAAQQQSALAWRKAYDAERALAKSAAATCTKEVGKSAQAVAQVTLDAASGKVTAVTVLLDEFATPKLRACLVKEIGAATLPFIAPGQTKRTIMIDLHP